MVSHRKNARSQNRIPRCRPARLRPFVEELETRTVPSASLAGLMAQPLLTFATGTPQAALVPAAIGTISAPYFPSDIQAAYGFDQIQLLNPRTGKFVAGTGAGQTIAITDAFNDPNIASDLALFNEFFGLPTSKFLQVDQNGNLITPSNPGPSNGPFSTWGIETSLDVEWAHALAPQANIVLFEANSDSFNDLLTAVTSASTASVYKNLGVTTAGVISNSWGTPEFQGENAFDSFFSTKDNHVTYVFASGDDASINYPSASPNVLSAGGTTLTINVNTTTGVESYGGETAWSATPDPFSPTGFDGGGGGTSPFEPEPFYQFGVQQSFARTTPDLSFNANPDTGVIVLDNYLPNPPFPPAPPGESYAFQVGGTSVSAPSLSALLAVTNQSRALFGLGTLGNAQEALYFLPKSDFHDVTSGANLSGSAGPGYDVATGLGSPIAPRVVQGLTFSATIPPFTVSAPAAKSTATVASTHDISGGMGLVGAARFIALTAPMGMGNPVSTTLSEQVLPAVQAAPLVVSQVSTPSTPAIEVAQASGGSGGMQTATGTDQTPSAPAKPATQNATPSQADEDDDGDTAPPPAKSEETPADRLSVDVVVVPSAVNSAAFELNLDDKGRAMDLATVVGAALVPGVIWSAPARAQETKKSPGIKD
jgi:subtilase family serine protease